MGNVLKMLKRDFFRLLKAPAALVVIAALLVLPSVYTWYNVLGFWNPYGNTGNIRVAVVNQDKGATNELTGDINVGDSVVEELEDNDQLSWWYTDYDTAMDELYSGKSYAAFVIPEDFSENMISILSGDFTQPTLEYYVNEKAGPVAPKITDAGATTLEETINSSFVSTVSGVVVDKLLDTASETGALIDSSTSEAVSKINAAQQSINEARNSISNVSAKCDDTQSKINSVQSGLDEANATLDTASAQLNDVSADATKVQEDLSEIEPQVVETMNEATELISEVSVIASAAGYGEQTQAALDALTNANSVMYSETLPAINQAIGSVATSSASLSSTASNQKVIISETKLALDQLSSTINTASDAFAQTDSLLGSISSDLDGVKSDLLSLAESEGIISFLNNSGIDSEKVADFMASPTELVTEKLYPFNSYGAAMAPLFMNLTFWIGAFMLLIIMRQEVDSEGVKNVTLGQRFIERYIVFAGMVVIQAVICCLGLMALGVTVAHPIALCVAGAITSLAFLAIIYTLSVVFQHIGKGICLLLIFLQIPSATGLYPIEMTAPFYQAVYPILPFTYGIKAMREGIAGFYGNDYFIAIGILLCYMVFFLILGLLLRTPMSNTNRMVAKSIEQGGIFNGENVDLPVRQYRTSQILRALIDKEEYRRDFISRYVRFKKWYPRVGEFAAVTAVLVPVITSLIFSFNNSEKVVLLTIWVVWVVILILVLIIIENLRYRFEREMDLDGMSNEELLQLYSVRNRVTGSSVHARDAVAEINRHDSEYATRIEEEEKKKSTKDKNAKKGGLDA